MHNTFYLMLKWHVCVRCLFLCIFSFRNANMILFKLVFQRNLYDHEKKKQEVIKFQRSRLKQFLV